MYIKPGAAIGNEVDSCVIGLCDGQVPMQCETHRLNCVYV